MDYGKLYSSFAHLLLMTIIQFLVSVFLLHHTVITILSFIACILCLAGLLYTSSKTSSKK